MYADETTDGILQPDDRRVGDRRFLIFFVAATVFLFQVALDLATTDSNFIDFFIYRKFFSSYPDIYNPELYAHIESPFGDDYHGEYATVPYCPSFALFYPLFVNFYAYLIASIAAVLLILYLSVERMGTRSIVPIVLICGTTVVRRDLMWGNFYPFVLLFVVLLCLHSRKCNKSVRDYVLDSVLVFLMVVKPNFVPICLFVIVNYQQAGATGTGEFGEPGAPSRLQVFARSIGVVLVGGGLTLVVGWLVYGELFWIPDLLVAVSENSHLGGKNSITAIFDSQLTHAVFLAVSVSVREKRGVRILLAVVTCYALWCWVRHA